jgi:hypothetical protein
MKSLPMVTFMAVFLGRLFWDKFCEKFWGRKR